VITGAVSVGDVHLVRVNTGPRHHLARLTVRNLEVGVMGIGSTVGVAVHECVCGQVVSIIPRAAGDAVPISVGVTLAIIGLWTLQETWAH
jgi:hypothetical protein